MARPSLKDQRSAEILDAYLTCVAKFGLEGATQERIAEEAQVKRPLLRHYLGNKSAMIAALTQHVTHEFSALTQSLEQASRMVESPAGFVELLFGNDEQSDPRLMLVWQALTASVGDYPDMREPLLECITQFLDVIDATLRRVAPTADAATVRAVAHGISAAYSNLDAMTPLTPPKEWSADIKQAAHLLTSQLEAAK